MSTNKRKDEKMEKTIKCLVIKWEEGNEILNLEKIDDVSYLLKMFDQYQEMAHGFSLERIGVSDYKEALRTGKEMA